jgi:hypothetical protein
MHGTRIGALHLPVQACRANGVTKPRASVRCSTPAWPQGKGANAESAGMRWVKAMLGSSPVRDKTAKDRPASGPADRRRTAAPDAGAAAMDDLRAELRACLALHTDDRAPHALRHLVLVHDELGRAGWTGVEAFPLRVLMKARVQAEMVAAVDPSPIVAAFIERLRLVEVAAALREEERPGTKADVPMAKPEAPVEFADSEVEVTQGSTEEYDILERSWVGTVPAGLDRPVERSELPPPSQY